VPAPLAFAAPPVEPDVTFIPDEPFEDVDVAAFTRAVEGPGASEDEPIPLDTEVYTEVPEPSAPPQDLMPITAEESASIHSSGEDSSTVMFRADAVPWAQQTVEVPLEERAQASAQDVLEEAPVFEEVFEDTQEVLSEPAMVEPPPPPPPPAPPPPLRATFSPPPAFTPSPAAAFTPPAAPSFTPPAPPASFSQPAPTYSPSPPAAPAFSAPPPAFTPAPAVSAPPAPITTEAPAVVAAPAPPPVVEESPFDDLPAAPSFETAPVATMSEPAMSEPDEPEPIEMPAQAFESRVEEVSFADLAPTPVAEEPAPPSIAAEVGVPADMVAQIAQRVVAQISERVVRQIAWEVIPDLAEALIKKEIERLKAELQQT
jgi:hypothetical protein